MSGWCFFEVLHCDTPFFGYIHGRDLFCLLPPSVFILMSDAVYELFPAIFSIYILFFSVFRCCSYFSKVTMILVQSAGSSRNSELRIIQKEVRA
jgi:hypothetical protein